MVDVWYSDTLGGYEPRLTDQLVSEVISSNPRIKEEMSYLEILCAWRRIAKGEVNNAYVSEVCKYLNHDQQVSLCAEANDL